MVLPILNTRLSQLDCMTRGFILHGFPLSRDQAELLAGAGHHPNRSVRSKPLSAEVEKVFIS